MILYPQQSIQQKTEYVSLAILGYALRDFGILRNVTTNDFGIDVEIDVVNEGSVSGRIIKAQVKASQELRLNSDGSVSVEGIKQSTLAYWMNVSRSCPVIVFAVGVRTEEIYFSEPVHKQAAALIDGTASTKTIRLCRRLSWGHQLQRKYEDFVQNALTSEKFKENAQEVAQVMLHFKKQVEKRMSWSQVLFAYLDELSRDSNLREEVQLHERCLQNIDGLFGLQDYWANHHLDRGTEIPDAEFFRLFLRAARILIGYWPLEKYCKENKLDLSRIYLARYWEERSNEALQSKQYSAGITYEGTRDHIPFIVFLLLQHLVARRNAMTTGEAHYWYHENPEYLRQVFSSEISLVGVGGKHAIKDRCGEYHDFLGKTSQDTAKRVADHKQRREEKKNGNGGAGDPG